MLTDDAALDDDAPPGYDAALDDTASDDCAAPEDPHLWLEEVLGDEALAWVEERNDEVRATFASSDRFRTLADRMREVLDSSDRIPGVVERGGLLYNFWRDADHPRGLWRRTTWERYRSQDTEWDVLIDLDALNAAESEDWVWHGARVLRPDDEDGEWRRALVDLSHGGSDADVTREFDLIERRFVPPGEGGFLRPEGKGGLTWIDADTVWAAAEVADGDLTSSGYARQARRWRRGTALDQAPVVYAGETSDVAVGAIHDSTPGFERDWIARSIAFYRSESYLAVPAAEGPDDLVRIDVPQDMDVFAHRETLFLLPRSPWRPAGEDGPEHAGGSLLAIDLDAFLAGDRDVQVLFAPDTGRALEGLAVTRGALVLTILHDVKHELASAVRRDDGRWNIAPLLPELQGSLAAAAVDHRRDDRLWLTVTGYLQPTTLYVVDLGPLVADPAAGPPAPELLKQAPSFFDAESLEVTQHFATSADGTEVPYFQIAPQDLVRDGTTPTLLYGYGGFEISQTPTYSGVIGRGWLERGNVLVIANIRGGGEYGPAWHQAALRAKRHRAFEDFAAVAADLADQGVADAAHLGCRGGSNGGLLTGNMLARYPDLFGAIVLQVPLLDMKRFSRLLAGASWVAEYGDPDTDDWDFLRTFSPYQLVDGDHHYPPVLLTTSTRDDRVHPGHARKMTARLRGLGADVHYFENTEGGHGGAADNKQAAFMNALLYVFLDRVLRGNR